MQVMLTCLEKTSCSSQLHLLARFHLCPSERECLPKFYPTAKLCALPNWTPGFPYCFLLTLKAASDLLDAVEGIEIS